jgi:Predicted membrane protein (DUF2142)
VTRTAWRLPALLVLGALVMQAAWILALPPFRGADEFDHAYRAAAVAHGGLIADAGPTESRGRLVAAPRDLIDAATPVCESYPYTTDELCTPGQAVGDGYYTVASGAGRYNPLFYGAIGLPSLLFDGASSLYAMRVAAAVLCSVLLGLAGWSLTRWSRTRWPAVGLVATITPVAVYSTAVAAPNGIEMCAALAVWCALLGLTRDHLDSATKRALIWTALPGALVLTTVRQLGPVWLLLITATVVLLAPRQVWSVVKEQRRAVTAAFLTTCLFTAGSVAWMFVAGQDSGPQIKGDFQNPVGNAFIRLPVWLIQSIGVFPAKDEFAPPIVYAATIIALGAAFCLGVFLVRTRVRLAIAFVIAVSMAIPLFATIATYTHSGDLWQGRYGLPYSFGVLLLLGYGLDQVQFRHRLRGPMVAAGWFALGLAQISAVTHVFAHELDRSPLAGTSEWLQAPLWVVPALMAVGWTLWAFAVTSLAPSNHSAPEPVAAVAPPLETEQLATQGA